MGTNAHELFAGGLSPAHYRRAFGRIPTSAVVVGALADGEPVGLVLTSFAALSVDPPLVGFFADSGAPALSELLRTGAWSFSLLDEDDTSTLEAFRRPDGRGFATVPWRASERGTPHLDGAALTIDAVVRTHVPAGDHTAVLASVVAVRVGDPLARPLVLQGGRLARLEPGRLVEGDTARAT